MAVWRMRSRFITRIEPVPWMEVREDDLCSTYCTIHAHELLIQYRM